MPKEIPIDLTLDNKDTKFYLKELTTEEGLVDFFNACLAYQTDPIHELKPTPREWVNKKAKDSLMALQSGESHFYAIPKDQHIIATCEIGFYIDERGAKAAYLACLAVAPQFRKQGLARQLTGMGERYAIAEKCKYIAAMANTKNLPSLLSRFRDGFMVKKIISYGKNFDEFLMQKKINSSEVENDKPATAYKTVLVPLLDLKKINGYLKLGYVGIQLKRVPNENLTLDKGIEDWSLLLAE